ncbi:MAG: beta-lactamase [Candidatus Eremiobacteraeota bacterium]|nr:beta-lactamase [Candidatus Eremiobacteraeota bacterium]
MANNSILRTAAIAVACLCVLHPPNGRAGTAQGDIEPVVARAILPVMQQYRVPGMTVGIVINGRRSVYNYGVESKTTARPVTSHTLFEIGSVSKTFTATLVSYAQVSKKLSLSDMASTYLPSLRGSSFDRVSLLNLGTHTSGGLPLQVPTGITNEAQLMTYLHDWKPAHAPGTYRTYSNASIGLLGMIAANSMHKDFRALMEGELFPRMGLKNTYLNVPKSQRKNYAQGYTLADAPVRMTPGVLALEAYGIRTTAGDMLRFVALNMQMLALDQRVQRAITGTHTGYYRIGTMTQDLIWEQYQYPVALKELLAGNSAKISYEANPATALAPPSAPRSEVLINKTGSTNGFSAYVAFIPEKKTGVVILANKSYPIDARVKVAYEILSHL